MLRERFDRVSAERLVSGPGLENIYWALTRIHGDKRPQLSAAEIFVRAKANSEPRSMMERIPTQLIMHPQPGLLGASYVALELFRGTEVMAAS